MIRAKATMPEIGLRILLGDVIEDLIPVLCANALEDHQEIQRLMPLPYRRL
jgi:hypothetical protein